MNRNEIEARACQVIERVRKNQPIEDDRIELKATLLDAVKSARLVAGHANAMNGEPILWLMGLDEKTGVKGVDFSEFSDWHKTFIAQFDEGIAPDLSYVNVPVDESTTILALYFETDRAPYVVKNSAGGHITNEVPWRQGINTFSAKRSQLLSILGPKQVLPDIEFMGGWLNVSRNTDRNPTGELKGELQWNHHVLLYVVPRSEQLVIPRHRCTVSFEIPDLVPKTQFSGIYFSPTSDRSLMHITTTELISNVPGMVNLNCYTYTPALIHECDKPVILTYEMRPVGSQRSVVISKTFLCVPKKGASLANWRLRD